MRHGDGEHPGRAWVHAACAFAIGLVLATGMRWAAIALLFGGWIAAALLLAVAALAFGAAGAAGLRRPSGWTLAWTVLVWAPASVAGFVPGPLYAPDGVSAAPAVIAASAAAVIALVAHPGAPRIAGTAVIAASLAATPLLVHQTDEAARRAAAGAALTAARQRVTGGSALRPYVATIPDYRDEGISVTGNGVNSLAADYRPLHDSPTATGLLLITEYDHPICGEPLAAVNPGDMPEPQRTCTRHGNSWRRTSTHLTESGRLDHGRLLRVVTHTRPTSALATEVLARARPMTDAAYHRLLFR